MGLVNTPPHLEGKVFAGLDEVGRGSFAGPVVTGAVIFPPEFKSDLIKDSKLLSPTQLRAAYKIVVENALAWSVQASSVKFINKNGINPSVFNAMHKCIDDLAIKPDHLLVDGTQWDGYGEIPFDCVPKGDNTYLAIAGAAIIAKVSRDDYMVKLSKLYPNYNFEGSKGYYCTKHGKGLIDFGRTDYHRTQYVDTWQKKKGIIV